MLPCRFAKIRTEFLLGLIAVTMVSGLVMYGIVLSLTRLNFDNLIEDYDVVVARSFADSLQDYYQAHHGWDAVASAIDYMRGGNAPVFDRDGEAAPSWHRPRDSSIPLVVTDRQGLVVYSGMRGKPGAKAIAPGDRMKVAGGEKILAGGEPVGYVFFKSMLLRSYSVQEVAFITSLTVSAGISVGLGLALAILLSALLSTRFARPISRLDRAVKNVTEGDLSARVSVDRHDELGSLANSFNLMADRLQAGEAARQNLLADIAHELRTPVSVIQANLEMFIEGIYAPDHARLQSVYDETKVLSSLITQLRSLSDIEADLDAPSPEAIALDLFTEECCGSARPLFEEAHVRLVLVNSLGGNPIIHADPLRLRQVFRNILGNALKYSPKDSVVRVTISGPELRKDGRPMAKVLIEDEGPGVPPGLEKKIFERFYRVDPSRNRDSGGRGLGLAICERIIASQGGSIAACNTKPSGLAVWFELPIESAPDR